MKYFAITEYDQAGGWEKVICVDMSGAFQRLTEDVFKRAVRSISYPDHLTVGFILSDFPNASVWLRGEEIELAFPNHADNT